MGCDCVVFLLTTAVASDAADDNLFDLPVVDDESLAVGLEFFLSILMIMRMVLIVF